jgi:hypothetical protein
MITKKYAYAAIAVLIAIVTIKILYAQSQQLRVAITIRQTAACLNLEDLQQATSIVDKNLISAITYLLEHRCTILNSNIFVKIEKGPSASNPNYVCIRPSDSDVCLWSPANNIEADQ